VNVPRIQIRKNTSSREAFSLKSGSWGIRKNRDNGLIQFLEAKKNQSRWHGECIPIAQEKKKKAILFGRQKRFVQQKKGETLSPDIPRSSTVNKSSGPIAKKKNQRSGSKETEGKGRRVRDLRAKKRRRSAITDRRF